jgi:hypothetical protein
LTLCLRRDFSPVTSLHVAYVDRMPVAQWLGHNRRGEGSADAPVMVFEREPDGALRLAGYAMPSSRGMLTYQVGADRPRKPGSAAGASRRAARGGSPSREGRGPFVFVAARPRGETAALSEK